MWMTIHALASPFFFFSFFFGCANNLLTPGLGWWLADLFPTKKTVPFYLSRVVAFALLLMPVLSEQRRQLTVLQKSEPKQFSLIFNTHVICVA
jgi:branched-subunit amino acid permease